MKTKKATKKDIQRAADNVLGSVIQLLENVQGDEQAIRIARWFVADSRACNGGPVPPPAGFVTVNVLTPAGHFASIDDPAKADEV